MTDHGPPRAAEPNPDPARERSGGTWFTVFLMLAVIGLGGLVLKLAGENRSLKEQLVAKMQAQSTPPDAIKAGETVGPLKLAGKQGDFELSFEASYAATLILQHTPGCGYCEETMPIWLDAVRSSVSPGLRVICVQVGARTPAELVAVEPPLQPCYDADPRSNWLKRAAILPSAVLVGPGGIVRKAWFGQMSKEQGKELVIALLQAAADSQPR